MIVWSIIGCGPSLDWEKIEPEGPVICINRAIQGAKRCDYWCCIDTPNKDHGLCFDDARRLRPVVLTQKRKLKRWSVWRELELRVQPEVKHEVSWVQKERQGGPRYSIISSIAWAVEQGAEEIRFFGVDMSGEGYHTGPSLRQQADERWKSRWKDPRKELDQVRKVYQASKAHGVRLIGLPPHAMEEPMKVKPHDGRKRVPK